MSYFKRKDMALTDASNITEEPVVSGDFPHHLPRPSWCWDQTAMVILNFWQYLHIIYSPFCNLSSGFSTASSPSILLHVAQRNQQGPSYGFDDSWYTKSRKGGRLHFCQRNLWSKQQTIVHTKAKKSSKKTRHSTQLCWQPLVWSKLKTKVLIPRKRWTVLPPSGDDVMSDAWLDYYDVTSNQMRAKQRTEVQIHKQICTSEIFTVSVLWVFGQTSSNTFVGVCVGGSLRPKTLKIKVLTSRMLVLA